MVSSPSLLNSNEAHINATAHVASLSHDPFIKLCSERIGLLMCQILSQGYVMMDGERIACEDLRAGAHTLDAYFTRLMPLSTTPDNPSDANVPASERDASSD